MSTKGTPDLRKQKGYSSQMAFVISLIAGSVGTGNIWRFPRVAAQNGGAFIICYIIIVLAVIIPIMMGEHVMGRATRHGTPGAFRDFVGRNKTWLGTIIAVIMAMTAAYYSAVLSWIVYYLGLSVTKGYYGVDKAALFESVSNGNVLTVVLFLLVLAASAFIAYKGVSGIEKANKVFIPILFICLIIAVVRSLTLPNAVQGLDYMFSFQWSDFLNYKVWLEGLTQAIWSAGPGWGLCITLAVFSKAKSDVALTSTVNGMGDAFAAILAGLAVVPTIFSMTSSAEEALAMCAAGNNGLTFLTITSLCEKMPGGYIFGIVFFLSLLMAGLSSNICHFMITALPFADSGKDKKKSILGIFCVLAIWGLPSAWNATFLSNQDWVVGNLMIVGCTFSCYAMIKFGTEKLRSKYINNPYSAMQVGKWWNWSVKLLAPAISIIMLLWWCIQSIGWDPNWFNPFGVDNLGTFLFQGALIAIVAFLLNNKVADSITNTYFTDDGTFPEVPDNGFST